MLQACISCLNTGISPWNCMEKVLCSFSVSPHAIFGFTPAMFCFALHLLPRLFHVLEQKNVCFLWSLRKNIVDKYPQTITKSYIAWKCSYFTIFHPVFTNGLALSRFRKLCIQPRDLCLRLPPKYIILFMVYFTQRVN